MIVSNMIGRFQQLLFLSYLSSCFKKANKTPSMDQEQTYQALWECIFVPFPSLMYPFCTQSLLLNNWNVLQKAISQRVQANRVNHTDPTTVTLAQKQVSRCGFVAGNYCTKGKWRKLIPTAFHGCPVGTDGAGNLVTAGRHHQGILNKAKRLNKDSNQFTTNTHQNRARIKFPLHFSINLHQYIFDLYKPAPKTTLQDLILNKALQNTQQVLVKRN